MNNGYTTLWDAADVLCYYGAILQGLFSMIALFYTILYTRKQIKYEHFEYTQREEINNIVCTSLSFVESLYPLRLFKIKLLYGSEGNHSRKILDEILIYQIELKQLGNKIKYSINLDSLSEINEFMNSLFSFANKLIDSANHLYLCYSEIMAGKNVKDNYKYIDVECENLQSLTNTEYQKILADKEKTLLKLEKN